jgi:hypothetical protein
MPPPMINKGTFASRLIILLHSLYAEVSHISPG